MKRIAILAVTAAMIISSCNLPGASASDPQIATAAALTVEAAINTTHSTPLASPTAINQTNIGETPTFSQPFASVEDVTNCRTGPGVNYERVTQIQPSDAVEIVGFFPPNYWIVNTDAGTCWVAGEFVTPSGSISAVPTVSSPPTSQANALQNVSLQKWEIFCNYETDKADVTIIWADKDGEAGYRISRNGTVIAELPANSTQFTETITLLAGQNVGYVVIAFNTSGSNNSKTITLSC